MFCFFWPPKKNISGESGDPWEHLLGRKDFLFNGPFGDFAAAPTQTFGNEPMVDPDQKTYGQRVSNGLKGLVFFFKPERPFEMELFKHFNGLPLPSYLSGCRSCDVVIILGSPMLFCILGLLKDGAVHEFWGIFLVLVWKKSSLKTNRGLRCMEKHEIICLNSLKMLYPPPTTTKIFPNVFPQNGMPLFFFLVGNLRFA